MAKGGHIGGKPIPEYSVEKLTPEQISYIEEQGASRGAAKGYTIIPDFADYTTQYLWHGAYVSVACNINEDGTLIGGTSRLREGWEQEFNLYVDDVYDQIERHL